MEQELQSFVAMLTELWTMLAAQSRNLLLPSRLTQIAILLVCVAVSWGFARATLPRMRAWMRGLEGWPKWRLRFVLLVEKRLWLMYFILLA